jgi:hypothetical protein
MKSKILIFIIIITVMIPLFAIPALAAPKVVDISRPEGNEIVTKEIFSICGSSIKDEATLELFYYDTDTRKFEPLLTPEGESSFTVGKLFGMDIELKYKGVNKIKIKAYTDATIEKPQIETYTITLVEEKEDDNWLKNALDWFTGTDATEKK